MKIKKITFICEQDGSPEQELKNIIHAYMVDVAGISKAFLVRVEYNGNQFEQNVALCIRAAKDINKQEIVNNIGGLFRNMFGSDQHLDILFIDKKQERDALKVCRPFFERA